MSLPPVEVPQGAIRFNTDSQKLEFYDQDQWWEMVIDTPALGTSSDTGAGARGVFMSGYTGSPAVSANTLDYVNISSSGNAIDFGDLLVAVNSAATASSSTRGLSFGGSLTNTINYITISSTGDAQDFGDLTQSITQSTGVSNSTRGIRRGGQTPGGTNTIDYVTIASTGDAQQFLATLLSDYSSMQQQNSSFQKHNAELLKNTTQLTTARDKARKEATDKTTELEKLKKEQKDPKKKGKKSRSKAKKAPRRLPQEEEEEEP